MSACAYVCVCVYIPTCVLSYMHRCTTTLLCHFPPVDSIVASLLAFPSHLVAMGSVGTQMCPPLIRVMFHSYVLINVCPTCSVQGYFSDAWNTFDSLIVIGSIIDVALSEADVSIHTVWLVSSLCCLHILLPALQWHHLDKSQIPITPDLKVGIS